MEAEYRRYQTNLAYGGIAFIAFGIWAAIKNFVFSRVNVDALVQQSNADLDTQINNATELIGVLIVCILLILFHVYMGMSAVRDSRGKKKRRMIYLTLAVIYIIATIGDDCYWICVQVNGNMADTNMTNYIIDMTCVIALIVVLVSAHKLSRYRRQMAAGE